MTPNTLAIDSFAQRLQAKMTGFAVYYSYLTALLCIKTDPLQMIDIRIAYAGSVMKIEDVAYVRVADDKHYEVMAKNMEFTPEIAKGILKSYPVLKIEERKKEAEDDPTILIITVPEMTKSRRDVLKNGIDMKYTQMKAEMERCFAESMNEVTGLATKLKPEEFDYARKKLEEVHDNGIKSLDELHQKDVDYIEQAYMEYESMKNGEGADNDASMNPDAGQKMKL